MRNSKRLAGLAMAVALVAAACSGGSGDADTASADSAVVASAATQRQGDPIPATAFETFGGETVTLANYSGKPLVVNFWASWCPSCVAEMSAAFVPAQLALGDDVAFLGVNIADKRDKALELVEETGAIFELAEDSTGQLYIELGGLGMPFTVYISADGQVLEVHNGPLTEDQLVDQITEVLLS